MMGIRVIASFFLCFTDILGNGNLGTFLKLMFSAQQDREVATWAHGIDL